MDVLLLILPLLVVIALIVLRQHMLVAGVAGALVAIIIGAVPLGELPDLFLGGVGQMLGITVPVVYAATAAMIAKAGGVKAMVVLAHRSLAGKVSILVGIMVIIQALATYMAGLGAGNTMVTAPLVAAAVGSVPHVIAGMAIATAAAFTTSPASTETAVTAEWADVPIMEHVANMQPYALLFILIGAGIAFYGVARHGVLLKDQPEDDETEDQDETSALDEETSPDEEDFGAMPTGPLTLRALPFLLFLIMVAFGSPINNLLDVALFTPPTILVITVVITFLVSRLTLDEASDAVVDGGRFILVTLFKVGMFLGFINMIGEIGTFEAIAGVAGQMPAQLVLPVAAVAGFVVAWPAGAFAAGVMTLIFPTLAEIGFTSVSMGLVAIAVGLGTQISPVQINVAALSYGFREEIVDIIRHNLRFVLGAFVLLLIITFFVG